MDTLLRRLHRWQSARSWARLIHEAELLWHVDVRTLRRLAAMELGQLVQEVPPRLRQRVNRWLQRLHAGTRLESIAAAHKPGACIKKAPEGAE
ncbi:MAG: hypothetical protein VKM01_01525 [Cyanobacteriota bacterium]|nr:hypothetical protein [Cyanobacteriota bacterium]